jgi:hypothetical protein
MRNDGGPAAPILGDARVGSCEGSVEYRRVCSLAFSSPPSPRRSGNDIPRRRFSSPCYGLRNMLGRRSPSQGRLPQMASRPVSAPGHWLVRDQISRKSVVGSAEM